MPPRPRLPVCDVLARTGVNTVDAAVRHARWRPAFMGTWAQAENHGPSPTALFRATTGGLVPELPGKVGTKALAVVDRSRNGDNESRFGTLDGRRSPQEMTFPADSFPG